MPFAGEVLDLSFQLLDGDMTKYVRATLREADGTLFTQVNLPHIGEGKYATDAVTMPMAIDYLTAVYEPFDDAPFTIVDEDHLLGTDSFRLEVPDSVIVDKLDQILDKIAAVTVIDHFATVVGSVDVLRGTLTAAEKIAVLTDQRLVAFLDDDTLIGVPEKTKIYAVIHDCA